MNKQEFCIEFFGKDINAVDKSRLESFYSDWKYSQLDFKVWKQLLNFRG